MGVTVDVERPAQPHQPRPDAPLEPRRRLQVAQQSKGVGQIETAAEWAEVAAKSAAACASLADLSTAIEAFEGCPLKAGATQAVVYDGVANGTVMVIGEGPGKDEDLAGRPFVGPAGQLLDRMLGSIGISRRENALITNVNYWRPPRNRNPEPAELEVCAPFVHRMVELCRPSLIITAGAVPTKSLLGVSAGITKLRGTRQAFETTGGYAVPVFPILHPAYLLRRPAEKSRAWQDLQLIERCLKPDGTAAP